MKISAYSVDKIKEKHLGDQKVFYFNLFSADQEKLTEGTKRWHGKESDLERILKEINSQNDKWAEINIIKGQRNLSGLHISDYSATQKNYALEEVNFDYCLFSKLELNFIPKNEQDIYKSFFFGSQFNFCNFNNCTFENIQFSRSVFNNTVFNHCTFKNVSFRPEFEKADIGQMLFLNCKFENIDFSRISLATSCFWGDCSFKEIVFSDITFPNKGLIGKNIIKILSKWDEELYKIIKNVKSTRYSGPNGTPEFEYYKKGEKKRPRIKYLSTLIAYQGLQQLYKFLFQNYEKEGNHQLSLDFNYWYSWLGDEIKNLRSGFHNNLRCLIARHILGYGVRVLRPLRAYLIVTLFISTGFLFSGLIYEEQLIKRDLAFALSETIPTMKDFLICLYTSITTATIGYGDIKPANWFSMVLVSLETILGILLITMFTVVFARRFFK